MCINKTVWTPPIGEQQTVKRLKKETIDHAVAAKKGDTVIVHIPREISRISWHFLNRGGSFHIC